MKKYIIIMILALTLILQGCAGEKKSNDVTADNEGDSTGAVIEAPETAEVPEVTQAPETTEATEATEATEVPEATEAPKATEVPEATEIPEKVELILPVAVNDTGKTLIQTVTRNSSYPYCSYIISSANGENIVVDPSLMPFKSTIDLNPAAIVSTHNHSDHTDINYLMTNDCQKLLYDKGEIQTKDFRIYTIWASHYGDVIQEADKNVIIVIEVDGLRIAHMGGIGQSKLTDKQLEELGQIDIVFMQVENSYSDMSLENEHGFTMIEQLKPKIVIPTHYTDNALPVLTERYGQITEADNKLAVSKEDLPEEGIKVYRILNKYKYF